MKYLGYSRYTDMPTDELLREIEHQYKGENELLKEVHNRLYALLKADPQHWAHKKDK